MTTTAARKPVAKNNPLRRMNDALSNTVTDIVEDALDDLLARQIEEQRTAGEETWATQCVQHGAFGRDYNRSRQ